MSGDTLEARFFDGRHSRRRNDGTHRVSLGPYAWRWYRVGSAGNTLNRSDLTLANDVVK